MLSGIIWPVATAEDSSQKKVWNAMRSIAAPNTAPCSRPSRCTRAGVAARSQRCSRAGYGPSALLTVRYALWLGLCICRNCDRIAPFVRPYLKESSETICRVVAFDGNDPEGVRGKPPSKRQRHSASSAVQSMPLPLANTVAVCPRTHRFHAHPRCCLLLPLRLLRVL